MFAHGSTQRKREREREKETDGGGLGWLRDWGGEERLPQGVGSSVAPKNGIFWDDEDRFREEWEKTRPLGDHYGWMFSGLRTA